MEAYISTIGLSIGSFTYMWILQVKPNLAGVHLQFILSFTSHLCAEHFAGNSVLNKAWAYSVEVRAWLMRGDRKTNEQFYCVTSEILPV